ncbi:MAG: TetR/AcrR family transcriptional regulator [Bacteroidetes bacterium]|nr:TetR/AcrR family transcriptional regulator [Bacteroidota bacterium]MBL7066736.1 TetR/AcrR family transcriptional regulator [Candidatus Neomarinimicrobiota bacterium]
MVEYYTKQKYEDKKYLIISVAEKFFSRFGLNKTTMDEIAKAARIGKATLYHYFVSKEHIFAEVIQKESRVLKNRLNEAIEAANNPKEQIRAYIITRMNYLNTLVNTYSLLTDEYLEHYACVKKFRLDFNKYEIQTLASILRDGVGQKVFSTINVNDVAKVIGIVLRGLEIPLLTEEKSENFDDDLNLITDTMLYGICK